MKNPNLLPYETIVRVTGGDPEAVDEVLRHYSKRIRIAAIENGHLDRDTEESIKQRIVAALFKFCFDEQESIRNRFHFLKNGYIIKRQQIEIYGGSKNEC